MPIPVKSLIISWRSIGLSLLIALVVGITAAGEVADRVLDAVVGRLAMRPVSGEVVIVALDERTITQSPSRNFSMTQYANVVEAVDKAGARRLFIDFYFDRREADHDFPRFVSAVKNMGDRIVLAVSTRQVPGREDKVTTFPSKKFGPDVPIASIAVESEFWQVWRVPIAYRAEGKLLPTFASIMAGKSSDTPKSFRLDLSYDTRTITEYSAADLLSGKIGARELAGKDVIFAPTAPSFQDYFYLPGHDRVPGGFIHVIAAETLKRGDPIDIGWLPPLLVAIALTGITLLRRFQRAVLPAIIGTIVILIGGKIVLGTMLVTSWIGAALVYVAAIATNVSRTRRRSSAQRENPVSGLPNFEALRSLPPFGSATVIAAKVVNFEDLAAFIPGDGIGKLVEQVTRRLQLASQGTTLHHDLDGTFAWLVPYYQHSQIEGQLAGLAALFNAPLTIGDLRVDVAIAFGVNDEFEGSNAQRLAAALVAAERAIRTRALWTKYTPRQKDGAGWQLSFHSQLEDALTGGDIWVAFQPQYEIATRRLVGVEALARWTHPTRGPIPPDEFIIQAEKSQDIYRLTLFVMDQAIRSAAELRGRGVHINMSVNLSATLLDHSDLVGTIRVMLTAHHLPPETLTIEITETAQIENSRQARQTLAQLRRTGIRLSIDDYGTGQSNLEYLTEIEADEIKIDKRFVSTMHDSQRNREVVKSTIDLAHRLGAVAVAEGIEDAETMALLASLGCDVGQGYHLGKPQLFSDLIAALTTPPHSRSA
ncbi:EAL domain-containing protein [Sphingopyxis alaskensis]|uniref:Diguanylate phosphodiesterase n=1 Tax=Sphingopyxis alaskensis (strain DSM 13593 / LMG 18877 / RB2256) TaxID=317655 RepID=Q1GS88_SPHAL|nr:EAL domain-containing protein [Sphingopyxis alaskensis]ABF53484.1 diguanylate phosphodiesterase [Sphingopyxis alaskensis RB2256]